MVASSDNGAWISPKWLVAGVALATDGLLLGYDIRLGIAASAFLGVVLAMWLYLALRYGSLSGAPSGRMAVVRQFRAQESNRRSAAEQSGAQQGADPADRP